MTWIDINQDTDRPDVSETRREWWNSSMSFGIMKDGKKQYYTHAQKANKGVYLEIMCL